MKLRKPLLTLGLLVTGMLSTAQSTPAPRIIYAYLVGKQDATHMLITEVMEATEQMRHSDLLAVYAKTHPETVLPDGMEALRFATREEAMIDRTTLKAKYEKTGKTVIMLEENKE